MKKLIIIGSIGGLLAVILGAMGAHALKPHLTENELSWIEKGIFYQFIHSVMIIISALLYNMFSSKQFIKAGWFFSIGILFFSGSLYLLALRTIMGTTHWKWLGPITPIGGMCLIIGWIYLLWASGQIKQEKTIETTDRI